MKIISLSNFFILPFSLILFLYSNTSALILEETPISLNAAWGMTWLDDTQMLITQKSGEIFLVDTVDHTQIEISHNIPVVQYGQGGLLDIINEGNIVWVTGSIKKDDKYTTAIFTIVIMKIYSVMFNSSSIIINNIFFFHTIINIVRLYKKDEVRSITQH